MQLIQTSWLTPSQKERVYSLWNQEYPVNVGFSALTDFDDYLNNLTETTHYLLENDSGEIEGWACLFSRDNLKWFAIILDANTRGLGKGTFLLNKLKENQEKLYAWVVDHDNYVKQNGQVYPSPLQFYLKNGFTICSSRMETEKLSLVQIKWAKIQNT